MSSLTAPWDKTEDEEVDSSQPRLSKKETQEAKKELVQNELLTLFPKSDRFYADPMYGNQVYCLHSFVPTKGAKPDDQGVYGFIKCRGTFSTTAEADQRAEWIIRNTDSYHTIQTAYVGRPFPIFKGNYIKEVNSVDIKQKAIDTTSEHIKQKREEERKEVESIKQREEKLMEETKEDYIKPPEEVYTELQVKRANLVHFYVEARNKLEELKGKILKTRADIKAMDDESDVYREDYKDRYMKARAAAGITEEQKEANFMTYLFTEEEAELGF